MSTPTVLAEIAAGEIVELDAVHVDEPRALADVTAGDPVSLVALHGGTGTPLDSVRALDPVPVWVLTDLSGTVWWGGYGPPSTTLPGVEPGDYYIDYTSGDVYRLIADDYGEAA